MSEFEEWCKSQDIKLCSCRINHDRLTEALFLQKQEFRFIELNYRPEFHNLQAQKLPDDLLAVEVAQEQDHEHLGQMAGEVFAHGRFHQDLSLGAAVGNRRYKTWLLNSFSKPSQDIYKCMMGNEIVGFFVVEYPQDKCCHWSLIGLASGKEGRGLGTRVWNTMMRFHQNQGIETITTSISSHNAAVFNLYVKLGFRFPIPQTTFHWHQ